MPVESRRREVGKSDSVTTVRVVAHQHVDMAERAVHSRNERFGGYGVAKISRHVHQLRAPLQRSTQLCEKFSEIV